MTWRGGAELSLPLLFRSSGVLALWVVVYRYHCWRCTVSIVELQRVRVLRLWRWQTP